MLQWAQIPSTLQSSTFFNVHVVWNVFTLRCGLTISDYAFTIFFQSFSSCSENVKNCQTKSPNAIFYLAQKPWVDAEKKPRPSVPKMVFHQFVGSYIRISSTRLFLVKTLHSSPKMYSHTFSNRTLSLSVKGWSFAAVDLWRTKLQDVPTYIQSLRCHFFVL